MARRLSVFEVGFGANTRALRKTATKALKKRKRRDFIGVEKRIKPKWYDLDEALVRIGVKLLPRNLKVIEGCAVRTLNALPAGSQDIILGAYVIHFFGLHQVNQVITESSLGLRPKMHPSGMPASFYESDGPIAFLAAAIFRIKGSSPKYRCSLGKLGCLFMR